jgi:hypothetical protein
MHGGGIEVAQVGGLLCCTSATLLDELSDAVPSTS